MLTKMIKNPQNFFVKTSEDNRNKITIKNKEKKTIYVIENTQDQEEIKYRVENEKNEVSIISFEKTMYGELQNVNHSGTVGLDQSEIKMIEQLYRTVQASNILLDWANEGVYIKLSKIGEIVQEHFEELKKILQKFVQEFDYIKENTYETSTEKKELEVERLPKDNEDDGEKAIIYEITDLKTSFEQEFTVQKDGILIEEDEDGEYTAKNDILTYDAAYLIYQATKQILQNAKNDVLNVDELLDENEFKTIRIRDDYFFKRTWVEGFFDTINNIQKITFDVKTKKINNITLYEEPKAYVKKVTKEEIENIERMPEKIKEATNYLFDDGEINQKIYNYERLHADLIENLDKIEEEEDKEYVSKGMKQQETEFLLLLSGFEANEVNSHLANYLDSANANMNEIFESVKNAYKEKMQMMLSLIKRRKAI